MPLWLYKWLWSYHHLFGLPIVGTLFLVLSSVSFCSHTLFYFGFQLHIFLLYFSWTISFTPFSFLLFAIHQPAPGFQNWWLGGVPSSSLLSKFTEFSLCWRHLPSHHFSLSFLLLSLPHTDFIFILWTLFHFCMELWDTAFNYHHPKYISLLLYQAALFLFHNFPSLCYEMF